MKMRMHLFLCEDVHASVFEMIIAELVFISSFRVVDLANKTILTFQYCYNFNQLNGLYLNKILAKNM